MRNIWQCEAQEYVINTRAGNNSVLFSKYFVQSYHFIFQHILI